MAFSALGHFDYVVWSNSKWGAPFHRIAYNYSLLIGTVFVIIWGIFHVGISLKSAFLLLANFLSRFRLESMNISLICISRINLMNRKESSGRLVVAAKRFLKLLNLQMLLKQMNPSLPRNLALETHGKLLIVFSKVNLLYLLYSTPSKCCLLHLIKQNCLRKTYLGTLILMTRVSVYLFSLLELIWNWIISPRWLKKS